MRYDFADCTLDTDLHVLTRDGARVEVEPQVFDLLALLVASDGRLVSKQQVVDAVWQGRAVSDGAISARIAAARKAVGDNGEAQAVIRTVHGRGLQFVAQVTSADAARAAPSPSRARQSIRYTTAADGTRIAYALAGEGPMVLHLTFPMSHLELFWQSDTQRPLYDHLMQGRTLLRHDPRGCGLSDRSVEALTYQSQIDDIAAVLDAAGWTRGPVVGVSLGGVQAVRLAVEHPERVSALVLHGAYVHGRSVGGGGAEGDQEAIEIMLREGWGKPGSPFMEAFISAYLPDLGRDQRRKMVEIFNEACPAEASLAYRRLSNRIDISGLLDQVSVPTLIIHSRGDGVHPLEEARKLAAGIPGAELVVLESRNDMILPTDPACPEYLAEISDFLDRHG